MNDDNEVLYTRDEDELVEYSVPECSVPRLGVCGAKREAREGVREVLLVDVTW